MKRKFVFSLLTSFQLLPFLFYSTFFCEDEKKKRVEKMKIIEEKRKEKANFDQNPVLKRSFSPSIQNM